jgi:hypothetical protein
MILKLPYELRGQEGKMPLNRRIKGAVLSVNCGDDCVKEREQVREFITSVLKNVINNKLIGELYTCTTHRLQTTISPVHSLYGRQSLVDIVQQLIALFPDAQIEVLDTAVMQDAYDKEVWQFGLEGRFFGTFSPSAAVVEAEASSIVCSFMMMGSVARERFTRLSLAFDSDKIDPGFEGIKFDTDFGPRRDSSAIVPRNPSKLSDKTALGHSLDFTNFPADEYVCRVLSDIWCNKSSLIEVGTSSKNPGVVEQCMREHALFRDLQSTFYHSCYEQKSDGVQVFVNHDRSGYFRHQPGLADGSISKKLEIVTGTAYFGLTSVQIDCNGNILRSRSAVNLSEVIHNLENACSAEDICGDLNTPSAVDCEIQEIK